MRLIRHRLCAATRLRFVHLFFIYFDHETRTRGFGKKNPLEEKWASGVPSGVKHEGYQRIWNDVLELRKRTRGAKRRREVDRLLHYVSDRRTMIKYPEVARGCSR
jgi:hypothetical protein